MERTLKNATSKLRNLKDLLSSTRNLSNTGNSASSGGSGVPQNNLKNHRKTSASSNGNRPTYSVSLFDLVDPPLCSSRPNSMAFSSNVTSSVSMYGLGPSNLSEAPSVQAHSSNSTSPAVLQSSRNPALRLFYSIRSKLRRRKRGRDRGAGGKPTLDSKSSDFGPYLPMSGGKSLTSVHEISSYQSEKQKILVTQSVNQLDCLDDPFDDPSFRSPLGCRDKDYDMDKENSLLPQSLTTPDFVISDLSPQSCDSFTPVFPSTSQAASSRLVPPIPTPGSSVASHSPQSSCSSSGQPQDKESGKLRGLTKELYDLLRFGWYWGALSKDRAEEKLKDEPDGAFIVRDSSSSVHILSLSFNSQGKTKHSRIDYVNGKFCFLGSETESFPSVSELIEYWMKNSEKGTFCYSKSSRPNSSYPVRLTKPISRFTEVKSLQFLSSFVLYQCTRLDLIPKLPLPPQLITYIGEQQYLA